MEPYRIYHYQGELPPETVAALVKMVRSEGVFEIWSKSAEQIFERVTKEYIELQEIESAAVELVLGPIGFAVAFAVIDLAHGFSELLEEVELRGAFFVATGLSQAGLYGITDPSAFLKVLAPGDAEEFDALVLRAGNSFSDPAGWLWQLAEGISEEYPGSKYVEWPPAGLKGVKPEPLDLSVYETSYCRQYTNVEFHSVGKEADCGPGYGSSSSPNIRTDLCIYISQLVSATCGIHYDAPIWAVSQEGVDQYLHHPEALDKSLP